MSVFGQQETINQVNALEFDRLVKQNNGVLLDVRTGSEFNNGHIANSGNLNFYSLSFRKKLSLLPKNQPIYLYCNTGYRSEKAAEILLANGYSNVYTQNGVATRNELTTLFQSNILKPGLSELNR